MMGTKQVIGLAKEVQRLVLPLVSGELEQVMSNAINARLTHLDEEYKTAREGLLKDLMEAKKDIVGRIVMEAAMPTDESAHYKIYLKAGAHDND